MNATPAQSPGRKQQPNMRIFITLLFFFIGQISFGQMTRELDSLTKVLETVYAKDQVPRIQLDSIEKKYGYTSNEVREQWKLIAKNDSLNIEVVTSIIDNYGWLSPGQTSKTASAALFLVIQHADLGIQEKYIETLKQAVKDGNAKASEYAFLLDRVNMRRGKFQIYGSQLMVSTNGKSYFFPIKNEPNVNKTRKNIGLPPLQEVAHNFGFTYYLPIKDTVENKIVITGFVLDINQNPINDVSVKLGSTIIATTNADGFYILAFKKDLFKEHLSYIKAGYTISDPPLNDEGKEVYEYNILLTKK